MITSIECLCISAERRICWQYTIFLSSHTIDSKIKIKKTCFFLHYIYSVLSPSITAYTCVFSIVLKPKLFILTAEGPRMTKAHWWRYMLRFTLTSQSFYSKKKSINIWLDEIHLTLNFELFSDDADFSKRTNCNDEHSENVSVPQEFSEKFNFQ